LVDEQGLYDQLGFYTLAHADPVFIHQNVVDAFAAQTATEASKPVKITFALIGLYLHLEKGFTGRQVQLAHMRLAKQRKNWPHFSPPTERGSIRVADVLEAAPGAQRDAMIHTWCSAVWEMWKDAHVQIGELCEQELGIKRS
jgi:uncharacterized protein DUF5946